MFHYKDNLFFGRFLNGDVRIVQFKTPPPVYPHVNDDYRIANENIAFDVTVDSNAWCSIIATMSAGGEEDLRFFAAQKFHMSRGQIDIVGAKE